MDEVYLENLRDTNTRTIPDSIPDILAFLFQNYGQVASETVEDKITEIKSMTFNVTDSLTKLYKAIENVKKLAFAASELLS